jgi:hypothetical protein
MELLHDFCSGSLLPDYLIEPDIFTDYATNE